MQITPTAPAATESLTPVELAYVTDRFAFARAQAATAASYRTVGPQQPGVGGLTRRHALDAVREAAEHLYDVLQVDLPAEMVADVRHAIASLDDAGAVLEKAPRPGARPDDSHLEPLATTLGMLDDLEHRLSAPGGTQPAQSAAPAAGATMSQSPQQRLSDLLVKSERELVYAQDLVTSPRRPSVHGRGPITAAATLVTTVQQLLAEAFAAAADIPDHPYPVDLGRHLAHAVGAVADAHDLLADAIANGLTTAPSDLLKAAAAQLDDAIAHVRMATATCIGEP